MKRKALSSLLTTILFILAATPVSAQEAVWRFMDFRAVQHDDNSITVDGILGQPTAGEAIRVMLSSGDFETVNGRREYVSTVLSETKGALNAKGYFRVKTPPVEASQLKNDKLTITVFDHAGQKTGYSEAYPLALKAGSPGLYGRDDNYAKYMDGSQLAPSDKNGNIGDNAIKLAERLAAGDAVSYYLDDTGKLWGWGEVPGAFDKTSKATYVKWRQPKAVTAISNVAQISIGGTSGAMLTTQGEIWQWDYRSAGTGLVRVGKVSGVKEIAVEHNGDGLILKQDGTVHQWILTYGKSDDSGNYPTPKVSIKKMASLSNINAVKISPPSLFGKATYLALQKNGAVWAWGDLSVIASSRKTGNTDKNKALQNGLDRYMFERILTDKPEQLKGIPAISRISLLGSYPLMVSADAELWSYVSTKDTFIKRPGKVSHGIAAVFQNSSYVLSTDGLYYEWNPGNAALPKEHVDMLTGMQSIAQGASSSTDSVHALGVNADGDLVSWGYNYSGQLGTSAAAAAPSAPYAISKVANAVSVSAGNEHVLALGNDGTIYGWGNNASKQIIGNDRQDILSPEIIAKVQGIKKLGAGQGFSVYLDRNGKLFAWGDLEKFGVEPSAKPTGITGIPESVTDIAVNDYAIIALGKSGKVYQLGGLAYPGSKASRNKSNYIRAIDSITDATAISIGDRVAYAVRKDGSVWYWNNTVTDEATKALRLSGLTNITKLAAARANGEYLIALDKSGDLWAWGDNTALQISRRIKQTIPEPVKVTNDPFRNSGDSLTYVNKKLNYRFIGASQNGALLLTDSNEMLFMGYSSYSLREKKLYLNVAFAEPQGRNFYWIIDGKLYVNGGDNAYGQIGNGTKSYFAAPQNIITAAGSKLNVSAK